MERFVDANKFIKTNKTQFTPNNPADFFCFYCGHLFYVECKSTINTGVGYQLKKADIKASIRYHQIQDLLKRSEAENVHCGFLIKFADRNTKTKKINGGCFWVEVNRFVNWARKQKKHSINLYDCKNIGIRVEEQKLRTNYRYNIEGLFNEIIFTTGGITNDYK